MDYCGSFLIIITISMKKQCVDVGRFKSGSTKPQNFTTYKDFTSDKSLESADFEPSFGEINGSFYSSGNEDQDDLLFHLQQADSTKTRKSKSKEEETNYTSKPAMILDREAVQKSFWCHNCILKTDSHGVCLIT